jgi:hypothetical protein
MTVGKRTLGTALAILGLAVPAGAETIQISSGAFIWVRSSGDAPDVTLAGSGFTFEGAATEGIFAPKTQCDVPECTGGTTVDLRLFFSGGDLPGDVILNGQTFDDIGGLASTASLLAEWTGSLVIPNGFTGGALTAPFAFSGRFSFADASQLQQFVDLVGSGIATLGFRELPDESGAFFLTSATYAFQEASPVPEPMSMMLVGTGLAGLAASRRRRTSKGVER